MKKLFTICLAVAVVLTFTAGTAIATKPGEEVNPNGFPSGEHYNLNIHGKKAQFICPDQEYDDFGNPIYGNSIFVPENGEDIQILMQSGKGKKAEAITDFQAIDPCSSAFDGDATVIQLPKNEQGYRVYARALAKPTDDPTIEIVPELVAVEDDAGNDLIYLGLVKDNGFETPYTSFTRKRGKSKAVNITGLFEWSGDVCYITPDNYCDPIEECTEELLCCTPGDLDGDGIIDEGYYDACELKEVDVDCPEGTELVTAYCKEYIDEWVFNIGDFVTYLWDTDNNGVKLLQVRFYPN
jgi:hypothetical protein